MRTRLTYLSNCGARVTLITGLAAIMAAAGHAASYVQQGAKLVGTGATGATQQGGAVAISADGNTAIVGAASDNGGAGTASIWTRSAGVWTQQGGKLTGSGAQGAANFGTAVAISGDGNTAIVGGVTDNNSTGAAWVFTRSAGVWTQQGAKLVGTGGVNSPNQGGAVALSFDGSTAMIGGFGDDGFIGAVWVFTRSSGVWSQQGPKLLGAAAIGSAGVGSAVALSADGNTAAVGGSGDDGGQGAVWIFTRAAGVWTVQGGKLMGSGASGNANQGVSVAISSDGNTVIEGGSGDNTGLGAAWVFTRSGSTWSQQGGKLTGATTSIAAAQGVGVSLSGDGNTAAIGGDQDDSLLGATWIFTRSAGVWTQQGAKLQGSGAIGNSNQGHAVALSSDGNTLIDGAPADAGSLGGFWIFTRSGAVWSQQGPKLAGPGALGQAGQGAALAASADGNTIVVGGPADSGGVGAVWVFTRSNGVFTQQGAKLIGTGLEGLAAQGNAVALSADGNTALVGGSQDKSGTGAVWVFTRSNGVWTQQGPKLVGTGVAVGGALLASPNMGAGVALSADGNTALVGGSGDDNGIGAAWIFTRSNGVWSQQGAKLVGTGSVSGAFNPVSQGFSVSLSADGNTALVGGPNDDSNNGAAWVYTRSNGVWSQQGGKLRPTDGVAPGFGSGVSLSSDGNTAVIGGSVDNAGPGAVWVFTRANGIWTQQGNKLTVSGTAQGLGASVSISGDGNTILAGAVVDVGGAFVWTRSGSAWTLSPGSLLGSGAVGAASQGKSVALSSNAGTAIVGGPTDNNNTGAVWAFTLPAPILSISKSHSGSFTQGQSNAGYTITVSNGAGAAPSSGTVTVTETIPSGLTLVSMAGAGWTCNGATCTRSDALAAGSSYPAIAVTVNVAANAPAQVTNQAGVSGGGSSSATANDPTAITSVAPACTYTLSPASASLPATSGAGTVHITTQTGCPWTAAANLPFITLTSASGTGAGDAAYTVTANSTASVRTGVITFTGTNFSQSFTITQAAAGACTFTVGSASINVPNGSGSFSPVTGSFTLNASNCSAQDTWTATGGSPRILSITPASGTGAAASATINFTLLTATTSLTKTYTIGVAGQTVSINQAGSAESQLQRVVRALYQTILGREPDGGGFGFWTGPGAPQDSHGVTLTNQMADGFYASPEFANSGFATIAVYQALLGRRPSIAEWQPAVSSIRNGSRTLGQVVNTIMPSGLTTSTFVQTVFQNLFGRAPSPSELTQAVSQIDNSTSASPRADFLTNSIFTGAEFKQTTNPMFVQALFFTILVRDPDSGGFDFWLGQLNPPNGQAGIYYLYNPQPPTPQYAFKLAVIGQAVPPNPNLLGFLGSPEFQGLIR